MSKLAPHRYGDGLVHSNDPENPIQVMHRQVGIADKDATALEALRRLAAALELPVIDGYVAVVEDA